MKNLVSIVILLLLAHNLLAQNKIDSYFSALAKNQHFNGNVLIAENGKVIYQKSFGYADFENKLFNKRNTIFPIASITKIFTATAIFQLYENKKLDINDPVVKYLQEFPYPAITIENLLSHTSGLRPYDDFFESERLKNPKLVFTNKDILPKYAELKLPLLFQPGETAAYNNVNYIFLALIVEKVSGISFELYMKKNIFDKAGMKNTYFSQLYHPNSEAKNLSNLYWYPHRYSESYEKAVTNPSLKAYWQAYNLRGFGEIVSSTDDLLKFDKALYSNKLLSQKTLKMAFTPVKLNNGKVNQATKTSAFGLGWIINMDNSFGQVVRGSGGLVGLRSSLIRNITKRQTIILLDNTQNETDDVAGDLLKLLNGQPVLPKRKSLAREFGITLVSKGIDAATKTLESLKTDTVNYLVDEDQFNNLGYDFMNNNKLNEALEAFKVNIQLFPNSWNVYDSYGEALLKNGQKDEAIKMYKKSLELNPKNENGKKVLQTLLN